MRLNIAAIHRGYVLLMISLIAAVSSSAQPERDETWHPWEIGVIQRYRVASNFKKQRGKMGFLDSQVSLSRESGFPQIGLVEIDLGYNYTQFNFASDTALGLTSPEPFRDVHGLTLSLQFLTQLGDRWGIRLFGSIGSQFEAGADIDDTISGQLGVGVMYHLSKHFAIGPGLLVSFPLDEETGFLPLVLIDWELTDRWSLQWQDGLTLSYQLDADGHWSIALVSSLTNSKRFRLDKNGPIPGGVATIESPTVGGMLTWNPTPALSLAAAVSAVLNPNLTIDNRAGREIIDEDLNSTVDVSLSVAYQF